MAAWPTGTVAKTHLDEQTDDPAQAIAELEAHVDKTNEILAFAPVDKTGDDMTGRLTTKPSVTTGTAAVQAAALSVSAYDTDRLYEVQVGAGLTNAGAFTLDIGPSARSVKLLDGSDPLAGQFVEGMNALLRADAINLVLLNPEPPEVSGYVKGTTEYLEDDVGSASTAFDVDAVIGAAWESVGPTGSGATNIWTALDVVPSGAKWVKIKINNSLSGGTNASLYSSELFARKTGSSAVIGYDTEISQTGLWNRSGSDEVDKDITMDDIPVDSSGRFDLYRSENGTAVIATVNILYKGASV